VTRFWAIEAPKADGSGTVQIPARSREHAEGMALRWGGDARVMRWTGSEDLHAAMLRGLNRLFGGEESS
jgi:hypothetical protein